MKAMFSILSAIAVLLLGSSPAGACAPEGQCAGPVCWTALLNNNSFDGTTCTPDWVGASDIRSAGGCSYGQYDNFAVLSPSDLSFYQDFEALGDYLDYVELEVSISFYTVGTPSWWDRIFLRLEDRSGNLLQSISIRTDLGPFYCHREDFYFTGNYSGRDDLRLVVSSQFATAGLEFFVDWIQIFDTR